MLSTLVMMLAAATAAADPSPGTPPGASAELVLPLNAPDGTRPEYRVQVAPIAPVTALAFDAATKRLFAAQGTIVRIWDLAAATCPEPLAHPAITEPIRAMALSNDGKRLAVASGRPATLVVFPTTAGAEPIVRKDAGAEINAVALSNDGAFLAAGLVDGSTRVWKTADLSPVALPDAPPGPPPGSITDVAFSPDGRYLATTATDGALRLREVETWKALDPIGHGSPAAALVFTDILGNGLAIVSGRPGEGTRLVLRTREAPARPASKDQPEPEATPPFSNASRTIETGGGQPLDVVCIPNMRRLLVAGTMSAVRVLNADNGGVVATLNGHGSPLFAVAANRDLVRAASADADGLIMLWDANTGTRLATLIAPQGTANDWLILTDRGPFCGPGLNRVHRPGNSATVTADDKGVQAILSPAPPGNSSPKGNGAQSKNAK